MSGFPDEKYFKSYMKESELSDLWAAAYASPAGMAKRVNPLTGKKELFIAGTRNDVNWAQNFAEMGHTKVTQFGDAIEEHVPMADKGKAKLLKGFMQTVFFPGGISKQLSAAEGVEINQMILDEDIDVVYGHSRGASYFSFIDDSVTKIGLDGAEVLTSDDTDYVNLQSEDWFTKGIGKKGGHHVRIKGTSQHFVVGTKADKKRMRDDRPIIKGKLLKIDKKAERAKFSKKGISIAKGRKFKDRAKLTGKTGLRVGIGTIASKVDQAVNMTDVGEAVKKTVGVKDSSAELLAKGKKRDRLKARQFQRRPPKKRAKKSDDSVSL
nr:hypothetical protein [Chaetoceros tenuissimus DNA virus type-II]